MTEIEFISYEPNEMFKKELDARGFKIIAWIPPRKVRKNSRVRASNYGKLLIEMDRELAHTVGEIAISCGVEFCVGAWSSRVVSSNA